MPPPHTIEQLGAFEQRGAGTDAERRAANWLRNELAQSGREPEIETFWIRPNWAVAHCWHLALGIAGSLAAVKEPRIGGAVILVALLSLIADALSGFSIGRRLTPERASQNVFAPARRRTPKLRTANQQRQRFRLLITANYDAGRTGLAYRRAPRALATSAARLLNRMTVGWLGWSALMLLWLLAVAVARLEGAGGSGIGVAQVIPTSVLIVALALLIDIATSAPGPAANDNGSGVATAIALAKALDVAPPRHLDAEILLQGASDSTGIGLRKHLRKHRRAIKPANTVVLGIGACGQGGPRYWITDGQLIPLRYTKTMRSLAEQTAQTEPALGAKPHRGRGATPAIKARSAGIPSIAIGCLDDKGLIPHSHQPTDTAANLDPASSDQALQFALLLVDAIDHYFAQRARSQATASRPAEQPAPTKAPAT